MSYPTLPEGIPVPLLEGHSLSKAPRFKVQRMASGRERRVPVSYRTDDVQRATWSLTSIELLLLEQFLEHECDNWRGWWVMPIKTENCIDLLQTQLVTPDWAPTSVDVDEFEVQVELRYKRPEITAELYQYIKNDGLKFLELAPSLYQAINVDYPEVMNEL